MKTGAAAKATRLGRPLTILVAGYRSSALALQATLAREGHVVHSVYSGEHVVEAVQRHHPDVCIFEVEMPARSGYAVARELSGSLGKRCPFLIAISEAWTRASEQSLAESVGFAYFFSPPAEVEQLSQFLSHIRDGKVIP